VLVPPDDPSSLANAIAALVSAPDRAAALGAAARDAVARAYSFDRMVDAFESLYVTQLEARLPRARSLGAAA
jgi:glycosyltransferase involved in cell wall biosynthesis